jgi:hypothetical protein
VSGNVGISGSLPAGSNDIGTVHVTAPTPFSGQTECTAPDTFAACTSVLGGLPSSGVINTLSVHCVVLSGQHVEVNYTNATNDVYVPLTFQVDYFGSVDTYSGTLTGLGLPLPVYENIMSVQQTYNSISGNGSDCTMSYTGTSS